MSAQYSIPDYVRVSADCRNLLSRIFVANPSKVKFSTFIDQISLSPLSQEELGTVVEMKLIDLQPPSQTDPNPVKKRLIAFML